MPFRNIVWLQKPDRRLNLLREDQAVQRRFPSTLLLRHLELLGRGLVSQFLFYSVDLIRNIMQYSASAVSLEISLALGLHDSSRMIDRWPPWNASAERHCEFQGLVVN